MGLKDFFKFRSWKPDQTREPPQKNEWPDHVVTLNRKNFDKFIENLYKEIIRENNV